MTTVEDCALLRITHLPASTRLANDDDARTRLVELLEGSGVFDDLSWPDARDVAEGKSPAVVVLGADRRTG